MNVIMVSLKSVFLNKLYINYKQSLFVFICIVGCHLPAESKQKSKEKVPKIFT